MFDKDGIDNYEKLKKNLPQLRQAQALLRRDVEYAKTHPDEVADLEAKQAALRQVNRAVARGAATVALVESNSRLASLGAAFGMSSAEETTGAADEPLAALKMASEVKGEIAPPSEGDGLAKVTRLGNSARVVYAPKYFWRRQVNHAQGSGGFGNIDIAFRMTPDPDYSIKGFRVDSAKLIASTVALTRQMVSTVAAAYGLPTSFLTGANTSSAYDPSTELSALDAKAAGSRTDQASRQAAARALLAQIAAQDGKLGDADRKAAVTAIKKAFAAQRELLIGAEAEKPEEGKPNEE
jgi:hypothetical protein